MNRRNGNPTKDSRFLFIVGILRGFPIIFGKNYFLMDFTYSSSCF